MYIDYSTIDTADDNQICFKSYNDKYNNLYNKIGFLRFFSIVYKECFILN